MTGTLAPAEAPPLPAPPPLFEARGAPAAVAQQLAQVLQVPEVDEATLRARYARALGPRGLVRRLAGLRAGLGLLAVLPVLPLALFGVGLRAGPALLRRLRAGGDTAAEALILGAWATAFVAALLAWFLGLPWLLPALPPGQAWLLCMGAASFPAAAALAAHALHEAMAPDPEPVPLHEFLRLGMQRHLLELARRLIDQEAEPLDASREVRLRLEVPIYPGGSGPPWRADLELELPLTRGGVFRIEYRTWLEGGGTLTATLGDPSADLGEGGQSLDLAEFPPFMQAQGTASAGAVRVEGLTTERRLRAPTPWDALPEALKEARLDAGDCWRVLARLAAAGG